MQGKQASIFLISIHITCLQSNPLVNILVSENNFFYKINLQLHILTNKLFSSLELGQEFASNAKIQSLLITHSDLNRISEFHSSACDEIQNMTSSKYKNTTELDKFFQEIINEEIDQHRNVDDKSSSIALSNITLHHEFHFVNELYGSISKLTLEDLATVTNDTQIKLNARKFGASPPKYREIKAWHPSKSEEDVADDTRRIYKGRKTRIKKYPFLVSIHVMNKFTCAGSIISKELVITAASCLQIAYNNSLNRDIRRTIFVRVGSDYVKRYGELIPIIQIYFHPRYDPVSLNSNVAIIRMMKRIKYSRKRKIQRIQYDRDGSFADDAMSVLILGWGAKGPSRELNQNTRVAEAHLNLYDKDECSEIYSRYYVTDKNFCAGFVSKGGGACNGDVGGPAIVSDNLVGIISFGPLTCGMADAPTVFAQISFDAEWIDDVIKTKPLMHQLRKSRMPLKPLRSYPVPILTTSHFNSVKASSKPSFRTTEQVYPEEMIILQEILQQVVLSNNSIIDYILYGDGDNYHEKAKIQITSVKVKQKVTPKVTQKVTPKVTQKVTPNVTPKVTQKVTPKVTQKVTPKVIHPHPRNVNKNMFLMELLSRQHPRIKTPLRMLDDAQISAAESSSYDEMDTGIRILESLVEIPSFDYTPITIKPRFDAKDKQRIINKVVKIVKQTNNSPSEASDSISYYEEDSAGITIEDITEAAVEKTERTHQYHVPKVTTSFHRINLEDYKNIIFKLNPVRESRGVIRLDKETFSAEDKNTNQFKNVIEPLTQEEDSENMRVESDADLTDKKRESVTTAKSTSSKSVQMDNSKKNASSVNHFKGDRGKEKEKHAISLENYRKISNESTIRKINEHIKVIGQNSYEETTENNDSMPLGRTMAISDEDSEYYDRKMEMAEYTNNMRSKDNTNQSIFWRFRSYNDRKSE